MTTRQEDGWALAGAVCILVVIAVFLYYWSQYR